MKTVVISTPKKAYQHLHKIKGEMGRIFSDKQMHDERKATRQPVLSLVDHMSSKGLLSHWTSRRQLAEKFGIQNYAGTSSQNARLLAILQANGNSNPDTIQR